MAGRRSIKGQTSDEPIDFLGAPPSQAKRSRQWEKTQARKVGIATYRGIPTDLNEDVKRVAHELNVTVGEVARAFLEYGLVAYREGRLELEPKLTTGKFSLFPGDEG